MSQGQRDSLPIIDRIMAKVFTDPSGCWLWTGHRKPGPDGSPTYGTIRAGGSDLRRVKVHRVIYEHHRGLVPNGLVLDHLCRVTNCVNPEHLEPVTIGENVMRGVGPSAQHAAGQNNPTAKLTDKDAARLRQRHGEGATGRQLAAAFGISEATVSRIINGQSYRGADHATTS